MPGSFVWSLSFSVIPSVCLSCDYSFTGYLPLPPPQEVTSQGFIAEMSPCGTWREPQEIPPFSPFPPWGNTLNSRTFLPSPMPSSSMHLLLPPFPYSFPNTRIFSPSFFITFFFPTLSFPSTLPSHSPSPFLLFQTGEIPYSIL
jgi:hypothetical protein